jgi:hypothetical protein
MPAKGKESTSLSDDVKPNTRVSTSTIEESKLDKLMLMMEGMRSDIISINGRLNTIKRRLDSLEDASSQAPAPTPTPTPIVTPTIKPSASFKSIPFRADEVGYFADEGDIVTISKDLWFRDVFLFTDRLKDIVTTKVDVVRANWTACLRGTTLSWYQDE